ncbi:MAG: ABC transporter permease [Helicobacteraceae bacterium]|jgi:putative ABC transport system permease protein|nr:ABC transporter permease [Helicobacteraceae bacterium]
MLFNAFLLALREIRRNILRSFLTTLGIVIGVASVIAMVMLGDGATASITNELSKLGTNMLILQPGQERRGRMFSTDRASPPFREADLKAIRNEIAGVKAVAPVSTKNGVTAVFGSASYATTVHGTTNDYLIARSWRVVSGREFLESELRAGKAVCILGETARKELFDALDPIGSFVRLDRFSCEVVGVLEAKGASTFGMDQDDLVMLPIELFERRIAGNKEIRTVFISLDPAADSANIIAETNSLLRELRKLRADQMSNFNIRDTKELADTFTATTRTLTLLLGGIAAISLLVGGIGIMNIMLVSVTERTREIGIRLAIGALEREVLTQFLVEAVTLSSLGGLVGIALGLLVAIGVTQGFDIPYVFNETIVFLSFGFSMFVGIVFGFFPARKAARLDPIEALRHE